MLKTTLTATFVLGLCASSAALAFGRGNYEPVIKHPVVYTKPATTHAPNHSSNGNGKQGNGKQDDHSVGNNGKSVLVKTTPVAAPEIDPATAFGGLTLLAGALAVARGRKIRR